MAIFDTARVTSAPGPARPGADAAVCTRPLGRAATITGGPVGQWQERNSSTSLPLAMRRLEEAGNLHDLRLAAGRVRGTYQGPLFSDSDLYKALEAIGWELGRAEEPGLRTFLDEAVGLLADAQQPDGYLNSYVQVVTPDRRYQRLDSHELYCAGHLIQAAIAMHRATGNPALLGVANRFADHLVDVFLTGGNDRLDGHPEIETALVELYRETGTRSYLELARKHVETRGRGRVGAEEMGASYYVDHATVRERDTMTGHAVRALYLEAGVVDVAVETGDGDLLAASVRRWEDMVAGKLSLTGGVGSRHRAEAFGDRYELTAERAYNETCAAIASIHWSWRLLLATGRSEFADLMERTWWNGFAASTSVDGTRFFYVNPLQRRPDHLDGDDTGRRHEWFSCACCPPNIMRLVASWGHYVATAAADTLSVHQFVPGRIEADLPVGRVVLEAATDYPWAGRVSYTVVECPESEWTLGLRSPGWSTVTTMTVGGEEPVGDPDQQGYLTRRRRWTAGEEVTLDLDLAPRLVRPHHRADALRGCVAIERGPLVYCLEQQDQPAGAELDDLVVDPDLTVAAKEPAELDGVGRTVLLTLPARVLSPDGPLYSAEPAASEPEAWGSQRPVQVVALPYFQWDNRESAAMRIWLPVAASSGQGV